MPQDPQLTRPDIAMAQTAEAGRVNVPPPGTEGGAAAPEDPFAGVGDIDKSYWLQCMDDAERAEAPWRKRGREIVQIYRNESATVATRGKIKSAGITFNILYSNTEVTLPAIYQKPPKPVVKSRFTKLTMGPGAAPPMGMPMLPMGMGGGGLPPPLPPAQAAGMPPLPPPGPAGPGGPMPPDLSQPIQPSPMPPFGGPPMPPVGPEGPPPMAPPGAPPIAGPAPLAGPPMPPMMPPAPPPLATPGYIQADVDTAASVIQKALEVVLDDDQSHEAVKASIKDVLLPGRGCARVRWKPQMQTAPLPGGPLPGGIAPTEEQKVWEEVNDEYVYWEDLLVDPVRASGDTDWVAFRHLFTAKDLETEFAGSPQYEALKQAGKLDTILLWTDSSAATSVPGGGTAMKTSKNLGDHRRKAMAWEVWDRVERRIFWFIRDGGSVVLRIDPDVMQLEGFYPIPVPLLAVNTSDTRIPRPFYDLYSDLAGDLDETSKRISALTKKIKASGAYNSASAEIQDLLRAEDGKMIPVAGVDMLNGGLQNHIWLLPIEQYVQALNNLYIAREQIKETIYEVMGISDIMRGATKATETATAQRIKGSMGVVRLEDLKQQAANFVRDMLKLKTEVICQNFDAQTLSKMTGEDISPAVMALIRSDFLRVCTIDIEADSTVVVDEQMEQEAMSQVVMATGTIMTGAQQMLQTGILPPVQVIQLSLELLKMALKPIRYSRPVVDLINQFQAGLQQMAMQAAMMPPPPPMLPPGASAPVGAGPGPGPRPNGAGPAPAPSGLPRPPIAGLPPAPGMQ